MKATPDTIYAAYYKRNARDPFTDIARVIAGSKDEAIALANQSVKATYPDGFVYMAVLARRTHLPVKNADGKTCPPSEVY